MDLTAIGVIKRAGGEFVEGRIRHLDWMKELRSSAWSKSIRRLPYPLDRLTSITHWHSLLQPLVAWQPPYSSRHLASGSTSARKKSRDAKGWVGWIVPRALVLVLFQIVVNLLFHVNHGRSFHATTPGVLTLFAASAIITPFTLKLGSYLRASSWSPFLVGPLCSLVTSGAT